MRPSEPTLTLVDELLAEQRTLTAVAKFSQLHERIQAPLLERHYRDLIPLTTPRPGEQYAFEVNLDLCSGCKACVSACHSLNGLDDGEAWREVGTLLGESLVPAARGGNRVVPLQQTVTTACHHCVEPACLQGCPVLAYDKDPATGIVRHLGDQCIGCSYCQMKCPYEVPKFSKRRGIVRKCDMCHDRLATGEAPACVQACPSEAIRIKTVPQASVRLRFQDSIEHSPGQDWLPDSPRPEYTLPTTVYVSLKSQADLLAPNHCSPRQAPAHWPLILMLTLTQAGIGGLVFAGVRDAGLAVVAFALYSGGLIASVFHLGQPTKAWRVWLGWRTSWLSREAIALFVFHGVAGVSLAAHWMPVLRRLLPFPGLVIGCFGLTVLIAQTMVYADTRRDFWRFASTFPRFLGSAVILGLALKSAFNPSGVTRMMLLAAVLVKLAGEIAAIKVANPSAERWTQLRRTAALQYGPLRRILAARVFLGLLGGVFLPFAMVVGALAPGFALVICGLCFGAELVERFLFFTSVAPDKMPGHL